MNPLRAEPENHRIPDAGRRPGHGHEESGFRAPDAAAVKRGLVPAGRKAKHSLAREVRSRNPLVIVILSAMSVASAAGAANEPEPRAHMKSAGRWAREWPARK